MKRVVSLLLLVAASLSAEGDFVPEGKLTEEQQVAFLLEMNKKSTEQLENVQKSLKSFREQEERCIQSPDDAEGLYALSEKALRLVSAIRKAHIEPYFRPAFLDELIRLSKTAESKSIPPVCPQ
jgi:hypothetical protein